MYVFVFVGFTFTKISGAVPEKGVPSDNVPEIVPLPVTVSVKLDVVFSPRQ